MPGNNDFDALMAAITDDPVPREALRDPAFAAEHAAAVADVALLRERLGIVGEALAASAGSAAPVVVPLRPRAARRRVTVALGAVAAAVAAALVGGLAWLAVEAGPGAAEYDAGAGSAKGAAPDGRSERDGDGGAAGSLTAEGLVACSRLIVEGTVTAVEAVPGAARDRITLDVTRYYKPGSGARTLTFPMDEDVDPRLEKGDRVMITIPRGESHPDNWSTGKDRDSLRRTVLKALPGAAKIRCEGR
ncbi:hypothetical protein [Streptomyces sp. NRRL S-920]|uniref:hypothetical protein n=1 Tax=Streptomyces sp. NRRL S-920 TaxID=1463921 RepID=UPI001F3DD185|nr:hypothetical protein [Streptomyces sp. NRRL S-920]